MQRRRALLLFLVLMHVLGCDDELDPTEPDDAYYTFRDALMRGDGEELWDRLDEGTRAYFSQYHARLVEMDEMIVKYLPVTDHRIARRQSGSVLLKEVKDGKALFLKLFQPAEFPAGEAYRLGSEIEELGVAENENAAKVVTRAGQPYFLTKQDDGQWYVMLTESSDILEERFKWLRSNQSALQETVQELISEEQQKREEVIEELFASR